LIFVEALVALALLYLRFEMISSNVNVDQLVDINTRNLQKIISDLIGNFKFHDKLVTQVPKLVESQTYLQAQLDSITPILSELKRKVSDHHDSIRMEDCCNDEHKEEKSHDRLDKAYRDIAKIQAMINESKQDLENHKAVAGITYKQISILKSEILDVQRSLASSASSKQIVDIRELLERIVTEIKADVVDCHNRHNDEVNEREKRSLFQLKTVLKESEEASTDKLMALEIKLNSYATLCELKSFQADYSMDVVEIRRCIQTINCSLDQIRNSARMRNEQNAAVTIQRIQSMCCHRRLQWTWGIWKKHIEKQKMKESKRLHNQRALHKLLTFCIRSATKKAYHIWSRNVIFIKANEKRAKQIFRLIIGKAFSLSREAFIKWRRFVVVQKTGSKVSIETDKSENVATDNTNDMKHDHDEDKRTASHLESLREKVECQAIHLNSVSTIGDVMKELANDTEGKFNVVAREMNRLQNEEITSLQTSIEKVAQHFNNQLETGLKQLSQTNEKRFVAMEDRDNKKFDTLFKELPAVDSKQKEFLVKIEILDDTLKTQTDFVDTKIKSFENANDSIDAKLQELEANLLLANKKLRVMSDNQSENSRVINELREKLLESEKDRIKSKHALENLIKFIRNDISYLKENKDSHDLKINELRQATRKNVKGMIDTQNDMMNSFEIVHKKIDEPGVQKPKMDLLINNCLHYEKSSMQKNYAYPLNSHGVGEEVTIPGNIANFAHDYAAWISYQADHDALQRVVVGLKREDAVFVDEDIVDRRQALLEE